MNETIQHILVALIASGLTWWATRSMVKQTKCCGGLGGCRCKKD